MTESHLLPISTSQYENQSSHGLSLLVGDRKLPLPLLTVVNWSGSFVSWVLENSEGYKDTNDRKRSGHPVTMENTATHSTVSQGGDTRLEHSLFLKCPLKKHISVQRIAL